MVSAARIFPTICGVLMSINFILFWAVPVFLMGQAWKLGLNNLIMPIYTFLDENQTIRSVAAALIYTKPLHADYFITSAWLAVHTSIAVFTMFYWQLKYGYLPWWLIFAYYCSWVGLGGRSMGGAYTLAHKEVSSILS